MNRILLIEDDPSAQLLYRNRLAELGYEVVAASTGAMGLMEARAGRFDLFLVDVDLGSGIDGLEVCRRLKGVPELVGIPVVLISGRVQSSADLHRGYEAGCQAFLKKGDSTLVEDVVRAMLRVKSLQDDLAAQNRLLEEQNRRLKEAQERGVTLESALRESESRIDSFRALATSRPDGILLVDDDGICRMADRGARRLFGTSMEGKSLASMLPRSGLEAVVRDTHDEPHENYRFDLSDRSGRLGRALTASVVPLVHNHAGDEGAVRAVLLYDKGTRRLSEELSAETAALGVPSYELGPLREAAHRVFRPSCWLGESAAVQALRRTLPEIARSPLPVWISGEAGCEVDLIARILHFSGGRDGPFVPLDAAALSPESLEREVRGFAAGAFPAAKADRPGVLQRMRGGSLYLAHAGSLPEGLLDELVRVAQEGAVRRLGSSRSETVDARLILSGEPDVKLPSVLRGHHLGIPPLRERAEDIDSWVDAWLAEEFPGVRIAPRVRRLLRHYEWPGNLRELRQVVETAARQSEGGVIEVGDLTAPLIALDRQLGPSEPESPAASPEVAPLLPELEAEDAPLLKAFEKHGLLYALKKAGGDKLAAARLAGVGKSTFYRKLKNHGIR